MKLTKLYQCFIAATVAFALGFPVIASAADENDIKVRTVKVSYADLDLKKPEGAKALYRRLQKASRQACDVRPPREVGSAKRVNEAKKCYSVALKAAVDEVDSELLSQIHNN